MSNFRDHMASISGNKDYVWGQRLYYNTRAFNCLENLVVYGVAARCLIKAGLNKEIETPRDFAIKTSLFALGGAAVTISGIELYTCIDTAITGNIGD